MDWSVDLGFMNRVGGLGSGTPGFKSWLCLLGRGHIV